MAIDEAIFRLYDTFHLDTIRFYGWKPSSVSIGKNQLLLEEVDLENLAKLSYQCVRRISGGGAVFHDELGELTYSIVTSSRYLKSKNVEGNYYELANLVFKPLETIGLSIDYDQIHCPSVFIGGKKISGNAQVRQGDKILQHGTILIDIRPEIMYSVLRVRSGRTQSSMIASVYQNVTSIGEKLNQVFTPRSLADFLITNLKTLKFRIATLTEEELQLAVELQEEKYATDEWTSLK